MATDADHFQRLIHKGVSTAESSEIREWCQRTQDYLSHVSNSTLDDSSYLRLKVKRIVMQVDSILNSLRQVPESSLPLRSSSQNRISSETRASYAKHNYTELASTRKIHDDIVSKYNVKPLPQLYRTENDALNDVYRLIMFEDFEGLKKRAMTMQKERT